MKFRIALAALVFAWPLALHPATDNLTRGFDPETQAQLRALAAEYIGLAAEIEGAEIAAETVVAPSPPSLWLPASQAPDIKHQPG